MKNILRFIRILSLILLLSVITFAGNTGKIIGRVSDALSGEAVIGVNVLVVGTTRGAVTDIDGKYTIIGIPIGSYTVRASQVGYGSYEVKDVKVGADETTPLNFKLTSSEVQLQGVVVTADQNLVNSMTTGSTRTVNEKSIQSIPNVKSVEDVLKLQAGVVKQGNNLFLRGGRANEVQYLVDGIPTNSILGSSGELTGNINSQMQKIYAGMQSGVIGGGSSGLAVSSNAIQSVSVQTSGFDADYGNAQSGIINIVTKSGSDKYTGSIGGRTDRIFGKNQNEAYSSFSFGGPEPLTKYVIPGFGIKIPGNITFFISSDMNRSDGAYRYSHNDFYNPIERKVELNGFLGGLMNGLGFKFRNNQSNSFTFNSKIKYDISGNDQVSFGYRASVNSKHDYFSFWKYRADSSTLGAGISIQNNISWQHFFSANSFIRVYLAKLEQRDGNDVAGITPPQYSSAYEKFDVNNDGFNELGTSQRWYKASTRVWSLRFDLNTQVHPLHLLKTGFEFNYEEINSTEIQNPTAPHTDANGNLFAPPDPDPRYSRGDFPGYGWYRYYMNQYPNRGGLYLQDNIELAGLNLHVGLRYDYLDIGRQVYNDEFIRYWKEAYTWNDTIEGRPDPDWVYNLEYGNGVDYQSGKVGKSRIYHGRGLNDGARLWYYLSHGYLSPRLSIGYPVTDRIVFYFNYGHFLQFPDRDNYYRDPYVLAKDAWFGNPSLRPQRTVQYEAGFEDQFTDDMAFKLNAFYKDIFDYSTTVTRGDVKVYKNFDYASTRGFEITLNQSLFGNLSTAISYSYQIAKGRSSNPLASIFQPEFQLPRETRLNWDQNHTANIFATYRVGPQEEGTFGIPYFNNYAISLTWSYGSGFPYTGFQGSRVTARNIYLTNSETSPYTTTMNLSVSKGVQVFDKINMMITFDVTNLLDRRNPVNGSIFNLTNKVYRYGDIDPNNATAGMILPWYQAEYVLLDPTNFEAPRQMLLGVKLNWD